MVLSGEGFAKFDVVEVIMPNPHEGEMPSHPPPLEYDDATTKPKKKGKKLDDIIKVVNEIKGTLSLMTTLNRIEAKIDNLTALVVAGGNTGNLTPQQQAQINQIDAAVRANDAKMEAMTTPGP